VEEAVVVEIAGVVAEATVVIEGSTVAEEMAEETLITEVIEGHDLRLLGDEIQGIEDSAVHQPQEKPIHMYQVIVVAVEEMSLVVDRR
jgi:hypothetical protein